MAVWDAVGGTTNALVHTTSRTSDVLDNLLSTTDELGRTTSYGYDGLNRVSRITEPGDRKAQAEQIQNVIAAVEAANAQMKQEPKTSPMRERPSLRARMEPYSLKNLPTLSDMLNAPPPPHPSTRTNSVERVPVGRMHQLIMKNLAQVSGGYVRVVDVIGDQVVTMLYTAPWYMGPSSAYYIEHNKHLEKFWGDYYKLESSSSIPLMGGSMEGALNFHRQQSTFDRKIDILEEQKWIGWMYAGAGALEFALHALPGGSAIANRVHGGTTTDLLIALAGDAAMLATAGLGQVARSAGRAALKASAKELALSEGASEGAKLLAEVGQRAFKRAITAEKTGAVFRR